MYCYEICLTKIINFNKQHFDSTVEKINVTAKAVRITKQYSLENIEARKREREINKNAP